MNTCFLSREYEIKNTVPALRLEQVQGGTLTRPCSYRIMDSKKALFYDGHLVAIKAEDSIIFPLWEGALREQGWENEDGVLIITNKTLSPRLEVRLESIKEAFERFLANKPEARAVNEAFIIGEPLTCSARCGEEWFDFSWLTARKIFS